MAKLYVILVVYNEKLTEIDFLNKFIGMSNVEINVVDNSTNSDIVKVNQFEKNKLDIKYFRRNGNLGLSKAYNIVLKQIPVAKDNWVMTMDQDTDVSIEYMDEVLKSINNDPDKVVKTGLIYYGDKIGSPVNTKLKSSVETCGVFVDTVAINSCLVINRKTLESVGHYDESLFLDMVDNLLFYNLKRGGIVELQVLPGKIFQDFAGLSFSTYEKDIHRFSLFKKDFLNYCRITKTNMIYAYYIVLKRQLNLFLHYKVLGKIKK